MIFRPIHSDEVERAHAILVDAVQWLNARNIHQWTKPYPKRLYAEAQGRNENFGLFEDSQLLAIVTIWHGEADCWKEEIGRPVWWISRLAVAEGQRSRGHGRVLAEMAIEHLRKQSAEDVWLDCVQGDGMLPRYYEALGFENVARESVAYSMGDFDMVLMRRRLALTSEP